MKTPKSILERFAHSEDIRNPKPDYLIEEALRDMDKCYAEKKEL